MQGRFRVKGAQGHTFPSPKILREIGPHVGHNPELRQYRALTNRKILETPMQRYGYQKYHIQQTKGSKNAETNLDKDI